MKRRFRILFVVGLMCWVGSVQASNGLFYIERNKNANIVEYHARTERNGMLDTKTPIEAYWRMLAEDGRKKNLTLFDRKAYGFSVINAGDSCVMKINSLRNREIKILNSHNKFYASIEISGKPSILTRASVHSHSGLLRIPRVDYIELYGNDPKTGEKRYEKITFGRTK